MSEPPRYGPETTLILPPNPPLVAHRSVLNSQLVRVDFDSSHVYIYYYDREGAPHPAHVAVLDRKMLDVLFNDRRG